MPNLTSQFSSSIPTTNTNPSIGRGGMVLPHIPLLFGGAHIPQANPMVGSQPSFPPRFNPILNVPGWSNQLGGQAPAYISSFPPSSSTLIPTNMFGMMNPPLSSIFTLVGGQFHTGNPNPRSPLDGGNVYNPHYNIPTCMVPTPLFINQFGGGYHPLGQGHGAY
jgi:hypothetical protein